MRFGSIEVELPIVQSGMGGGLARHRLATAVAAAGGLGTIGMLGPDDLRAEIATAKAHTSRPIAINLLLPFTRSAHWKAAADADLIVTFFGEPRRRSKQAWIHQCGSVEESIAARDAGADAVILQGVEAGGHVRGERPAHDFLLDARRKLPPTFPVLLAGGIATRDDVGRALEHGADGTVLGTRFLLAEESDAHAAYKDRLCAADRTVLTHVFGFGWPVPHRVVPNAATAYWKENAPRWMRALHSVTKPFTPLMPIDGGASTPWQSVGSPILTPKSPTTRDTDPRLDTAPLYAGETVSRLTDIRPAASIVHDLIP